MTIQPPIAGLVLEPTIAMHRGESFVCQCQGCGSLTATTSSSSARRPADLGPCPSCGLQAWTQQHVPVGPFRAKWGWHLTGAVHRLLTAPAGGVEARMEELRQAYRRAISSTRETNPWHQVLSPDE